MAKLIQDRAPIMEALERFKMMRVVPFDVPGHKRGKGSRELTFLLVGFASMYLPWVLVPRVAFIYHFFPCVIFVVLGIVYFIKRFVEKDPKEKKYVYLYLAAVFVLFLAFYPVLTGIAVPTAYVENCLRWLPSWVLG